ncbi:MAG: hypothetical protein RBJ76_00875 [Stenomitos frigidus ULC029]
MALNREGGLVLLELKNVFDRKVKQPILFLWLTLPAGYRKKLVGRMRVQLGMLLEQLIHSRSIPSCVYANGKGW